MKKALLLAPMGSVHRRFNQANIEVLQSLGYEVHLAANFDNGEGPEAQNQEYAASCRGKGIVTHYIPFRRHELRGNLPLVKETKELVQNECYDLIHSHTETGGLIHRLLGKTGARNIYTAHGMSFYKGSSLKSQMVYRPIERWICSGMDANIAINQEEYRTLQRWNSDTAYFVHGIGLDLARFAADHGNWTQIRSELGIPQDATVVLSVGELDDNKNHITVLKALANTDLYYLICGVGPNEEKLRQAATESGMGNRLILAGYRKDIPFVIHACDIFAFPSYHEGMPVSLLEAMAGGLPVVCSTIRGNVDVVREGENGYLAEPEDVNGWRRDLSLLARSPNLREFFIANGRKTVDLYSQSGVRSELLAIYSAK